MKYKYSLNECVLQFSRHVKLLEKKSAPQRRPNFGERAPKAFCVPQAGSFTEMTGSPPGSALKQKVKMACNFVHSSTFQRKIETFVNNKCKCFFFFMCDVILGIHCISLRMNQLCAHIFCSAMLISVRTISKALKYTMQNIFSKF